MATVMGNGYGLAWKPTLLASALCAALTACGGGGGGGGSTGGENPSGQPDGGETRESLSVRVVDGPIHNAIVCLDLNTNGLCDSGEPSATTDADGRAVLQAPPGQVGQYPVVARVGTDAIDRDHGPVSIPFTMSAPADQPALISPLTTLVHVKAALQNLPTQEAAAQVQSTLGLDFPPLTDFTASNAQDAGPAAKVARLLVLVTQAQQEATKGATDASNNPLPQQQIDRAINERLLQMLPSVTLGALDNLGDSPTADDYAQAGELLANEAGLTLSNIAAVIAQNTSITPAPSPEAGQAYRRLRWFWYTDNQNFELRWIQASASQNTPDSNGTRRYVEFREGARQGTPWAWSDTDTHPLLYWSNDLKQWRECKRLEEHTTQGTESLHCKAQRLQSTITREEDLTGKSVLETIERIRSYPLYDAPGAFSNWGPDTQDPAIRTLLSGKTFPTGAQLRYQTVQDIQNPETLDLPSKRARIPADANDLDNPDGPWKDATLAEFIQHNSRGYNLSVTDVHGNNSYVLLNRDYRKVGSDPVYAGGFNAFKRYMVAFQSVDATSGQARFFECEGNTAPLIQDLNDGKTLQDARRRTLFINGQSTCQQIGQPATYQIRKLGNRNVLGFTWQPAQLGNDRDYLFIDRPGHETNWGTVVGYREKLKVRYQQRLNDAAAQTLFDALGLRPAN